MLAVLAGTLAETYACIANAASGPPLHTPHCANTIVHMDMHARGMSQPKV
jgi:hypothetical protein